MQELSDFVSTLSHHFEPVRRDGPQFVWLFFHPRVDGRISLNGAIQLE